MTDELLSEVNEMNYHAELVGEGKKFKDDDALAKGKYIADQYIATLEAKLDQLRTEYQNIREENVANKKLQDLIDQARNPPARDYYPEVEKPKPTIDPKQIESLIDTRISERENARKQTENMQMVRSKLEASYGKDFQNTLQEKITELDMSLSEANNLARTNPKMLLRLLEVDKPVEAPQQDVFRAPPRSSQTPAFKPTQEVRTWDWYQKLKATDPKKYYSPETNIQMHKDALALGARFEDGDFNAYEKDYRISF